MKIGDTVQHDMTGITGKVISINRDMVTFYSRGHYINSLIDELKIIKEGKDEISKV